MWIESIGNLRTSGRPVLITGHTGFKGTWLTLLLELHGIEVAGISLEPEPESLFSTLSRTGSIQEFFIDIRDFESTIRAVQIVNPAAVFHLAAQSLVLNSYKDPISTFETNVIGTANLLESVRRLEKQSAVVVATTDKVYKNLELDYKYKETDNLQGSDPYSASKVGTENVVAAWKNICEIEDSHKICSVRAGNVIGGGDFSKNRLVPDIIRGIKSDTSVEIRNPRSSRPWQHALDPLTGYLSAAAELLSGKDANSFNFGPTEKSLSVGDVLKIAKNEFGEKLKLSFSEPTPKKFESDRLDLDSTLAKEVLGWKPKWNQEQAIKMTFSWWREVLERRLSPLEACQQDISNLAGVQQD